MGLSVIATQQQQHHDALLAVTNIGRSNLVEKWSGINKLCHLILMLCLPNEAALNVACPVYEAMALASKAFKMEELQDVIDINTVAHRKKYTAVVLSNAIFSNFTSLR